MSTEIIDQIARYKRGIKKAEAWVAEQDATAGSADDAEPYLAAAEAGREKIHEMRVQIGSLREQLVEAAPRYGKLVDYERRFDECIASIDAGAGNSMNFHLYDVAENLITHICAERTAIGDSNVPPPVTLRYVPKRTGRDIVEIIVGQISDDIWTGSTHITIGATGYWSKTFSFGTRYATEVEAWIETIGDVARHLRETHEDSAIVGKAQEWLDAVAFDHGVDIETELSRRDARRKTAGHEERDVVIPPLPADCPFTLDQLLTGGFNERDLAATISHAGAHSSPNAS